MSGLVIRPEGAGRRLPSALFLHGTMPLSARYRSSGLVRVSRPSPTVRPSLILAPRMSTAGAFFLNVRSALRDIGHA